MCDVGAPKGSRHGVWYGGGARRVSSDGDAGPGPAFDRDRPTNGQRRQRARRRRGQVGGDRESRTAVCDAE